MKLLKFIFYFLFFVFCTSCAKDEEFPTIKAYPIINTLSAVADSTGINAKGEVKVLGAKEITEYGFIFTSTTSSKSYTLKKAVGNSNNKGIFEGRISTDIINGVSYNVQAYAMVNGFTVYGPIVSVTGLGSASPVVTDFYPKEGFDETLITITGSNFSEIQSLVKVKIGHDYATIVETSLDRIVVKSPKVAYLGSFPVEVTINGQVVIAKDKFTIVGPYITHLSVNKTIAGNDITIFGNYFLHPLAASWGPSVEFGGKTGTIKSRTETEIVVTVPPVSSQMYDKPLSIFITGWNKTVQLPNSLTIESGFKLASVLPSAIGATQTRMPSFVIGGKAFFFDFDHLISYDIATGNWQNKGKFPATGVYNPIIEQIGDKVYLIGGRNGNTYYGNVWEYDHTTDTWTKKPSLTFAVYGATSFVLDNKIYFFGGQNSNNSRRLWQYDPATGNMVGLNLFPVSTFAAPAFKSGNNVYAIVSNTLWAYNVQQDSWLNKGNSPSNSVVFTFNNKGYAVSSNNDLGLSWYNETENKWVKVGNYTGCVNNSTFSGFAFENKLYVASFGSCSYNLYYYEAP